MEQATSTINWIELLNNIIKAVTVLVPTLTAFWYSIQKRKNIKELENSTKLVNHPIHQKIDSYIRYINNNLIIDDIGKYKLWHDILLHKYTTWKIKLMELSKETDECIQNCKKRNCNSCEKLLARNLKVFNEGVDEYSNYFRNGDYNSEEIELLDYALKRYNNYHSDKVEYVEDKITSIIEDDKFNKQCFTKQSNIFFAYDVSLEFGIKDALNAISSINGHLDNKTFRGETIGKGK